MNRIDGKELVTAGWLNSIGVFAGDGKACRDTEHVVRYGEDHGPDGEYLYLGIEMPQSNAFVEAVAPSGETLSLVDVGIVRDRDSFRRLCRALGAWDHETQAELRREESLPPKPEPDGAFPTYARLVKLREAALVYRQTLNNFVEGLFAASRQKPAWTALADQHHAATQDLDAAILESERVT